MMGIFEIKYLDYETNPGKSNARPQTTGAAIEVPSMLW